MAFKSHILTKKETKQKRNLTKATLVSDADTSNVKLMLNMKWKITSVNVRPGFEL